MLATAKALEDLAVSAYNGATKLFTVSTNGTAYLDLAGKIVSVEARHAAAIRDLLNPLSADFAGDDQVDASGLDKANTPATVLGTAKTYVTGAITFSNLPGGGNQ